MSFCHMLVVVGLIAIAFLLLSPIRVVDAFNYCGKFGDLCPDEPHFMCNRAALKPESEYRAHVPMTRTIRRYILDAHNKYRNAVAGGSEISSGKWFLMAARMREVIWDDELAFMAHVHAGLCVTEKDKCHNTERFPIAGQNLGLYSTQQKRRKVAEIIDSIIAGWYDEKNAISHPGRLTELYDVELHSEIEHLAAMIHDGVSRIGCALAFCENCKKKNAIADGVPNDNPHLVLLFYLAQLFLRELVKSYRLIQVVPMDMSGYYENRAGPSNLGNVISQILLCKQITPDFNQEELCSITKDSQEIAMLLSEMQEYMPQHETFLERNAALDTSHGPWPSKRRRNSIYKNMGLLCCVSRPNYL